jgi:predicted dehydrogenase
VSANLTSGYRWRVAIVGLGHRGLLTCLPTVLRNPMCDLVALCDSSDSVSEGLGVRFPSTGPIQVFKETAQLEKFDFDLAIVATSHDSHLSLACQMLRHDIRVIMEKPVVRNLDELSELTEVSSRCDGELLLSLPTRYDPQISSLLDWFRSRDGDSRDLFIQVLVSASQASGGWRASRETAGGGIVIDLGYHYIDVLILRLGVPLDICYQPSEFYDGIGDAESAATIILIFPAHRSVTLSLLACPDGWPKSRRIWVRKRYSGWQRWSHEEGRVNSYPTKSSSLYSAVLNDALRENVDGWRDDLAAQTDVLSTIQAIYGAESHFRKGNREWTNA